MKIVNVGVQRISNYKFKWQYFKRFNITLYYFKCVIKWLLTIRRVMSVLYYDVSFSRSRTRQTRRQWWWRRWWLATKWSNNTKKATDLSAHRRCVLKFVNTAERFPYTSRDAITLYDALREKGMWIRVSIVRVYSDVGYVK